MIFLYLAILILTIYKARFTPPQIQTSLSTDCTSSIKGTFILIVFLRHLWPYMSPLMEDNYSYFDRLFITADSMVRQLLVVMFLFYSGYGVARSLANKGKDYLDGIPVRRIGVTLANFAVAVIGFIILGLTIGREMTLKECLLSFSAWESVGNSNWYIFCIIICYAFTYTAFRLCHSPNHATALLGLLCLGYIITLSHFKSQYWYDTIAAYWFGTWFAVNQEKFGTWLERHHITVLIASLSLFGLFYTLPYRKLALADNMTAIFFALSVVLITMRIHINNAPLRWLGKHLFPLYIYQRIPMILFAAIGEGYLIREKAWAYVALSICATLSIAAFYSKWAITYSPQRHSFAKLSASLKRLYHK